MDQFYIVKDGRVYTGYCCVDGNFITVYAGDSSKPGQLNGMGAESLARILLGHLVKDGSALPEKSEVLISDGGISLLKIIESGPNGTEVVTFLVAGPGSACEAFASLFDAKTYFDSRLATYCRMKQSSSTSMSL